MIEYGVLWCVGAIFFLTWAQYRSLHLINNVFVDIYACIDALAKGDSI